MRERVPQEVVAEAQRLDGVALLGSKPGPREQEQPQNERRPTTVEGRSGRSIKDSDVARRYNTDGSLDATFGTNGIVRTSVGPGTIEVVDAAAVQPDDKTASPRFTIGAGIGLLVICAWMAPAVQIASSRTMTSRIRVCMSRPGF